MSHLDARLESVRRLLTDAETAYELVIHGDRISGQAVAALLKRREDLTRELHDIRDRIDIAAEDTAPVTEAQMIAAAVADLAALPDPALDDVLMGLVREGRGAALRRCAPPALHVVGG